MSILTETLKCADDKDIGSGLSRSRTAGGHIEDRSQPALPVVHRRLANPAPLGLFSLATSMPSFSLLSTRVLLIMLL